MPLAKFHELQLDGAPKQGPRLLQLRKLG
jgi:hypothetical protein